MKDNIRIHELNEIIHSCDSTKIAEHTHSKNGCRYWWYTCAICGEELNWPDIEPILDNFYHNKIKLLFEKTNGTKCKAKY